MSDKNETAGQKKRIPGEGYQTIREEYGIIRDEMLQWQSRRFTLVSLSVSVVTAVLALDLLKDQQAGSSWVVLSTILLAFLAVMSILSWYCASANAKASAYLKCFHEDYAQGQPRSSFLWESRLSRLSSLGGNPLHMNQLLVVLYLVLGFLVTFVPWQASGEPLAALKSESIIISWIVLLAANLTNFFRWFLYGFYGRKWQEVKMSEG